MSGFILLLWMLLSIGFVVLFVMVLFGALIPPREPEVTDGYWMMLGEKFREDWSDAFKRMELTDEEIDEYVAKYIRKHKKYYEDQRAEKRRWWQRR